MKQKSIQKTLLIIALLWATSSWSLAIDSNWPQFRGPTGDGMTSTNGLPTVFSDSESVRWKTPIHGKAWSSPVIWGSQVWMTTANEEGTELSIVCVDKESGKILRDEILFRVESPQFCHKFNSYASPTPVIEEGRIYVTFGSPGTCCLDTATGEKIWERTDFVCNHFRAAGSSPVLWNNLLIMNFDGSDFQFMVALDKSTGNTVWRTDRSVDFQDLDSDGKPKAEGDYRKGFSTPHVSENNGQPVLISSGAKAHYAYDPATGKELWRLEDLSSHSPCTRPVIGHGMAFIPTGHGKAGLVAVKLGGLGVLDESNVAWRMTKTFPNKPSVTLVDDMLFVINDLGIASCLDAKTGNVEWSQRLGGNFSSSPIYSNGLLYVGNEDGKLFVFEANRKFKLISENEFADGFMASPAVSGDSLFLRTKSQLYRIAK
ncbi:MAG: PQQ-binding-like beta-propeller repeat protein [Pirellulaceae bacterium]|nr:PQQ-binding-like beta-propeller repeat protein [Pirellulaceae bacterium]